MGSFVSEKKTFHGFQQIMPYKCLIFEDEWTMTNFKGVQKCIHF